MEVIKRGWQADIHLEICHRIKNCGQELFQWGESIRLQHRKAVGQCRLTNCGVKIIQGNNCNWDIGLPELIKDYFQNLFASKGSVNRSRNFIKCS